MAVHAGMLPVESALYSPPLRRVDLVEVPAGSLVDQYNLGEYVMWAIVWKLKGQYCIEK